jgi:hypothetical protein
MIHTKRTTITAARTTPENVRARVSASSRIPVTMARA